MGFQWQGLDHFVSLPQCWRGKRVFSGLSSSSLCDKRLLCSTHTVGRPLTGLSQLAGRGLSVSELTHAEIWHKKTGWQHFHEYLNTLVFQVIVFRVRQSIYSLSLFQIPPLFSLYLVSDSGDKGMFSVDQRDLWRWAAAGILISSASALTTDLSNTQMDDILRLKSRCWGAQNFVNTAHLQCAFFYFIFFSSPKLSGGPHLCWPMCCCCTAFPSVGLTARGKCAVWANSSGSEASSALSGWWCSPESGRWSCWPKTKNFQR